MVSNGSFKPRAVAVGRSRAKRVKVDGAPYADDRTLRQRRKLIPLPGRRQAVLAHAARHLAPFARDIELAGDSTKRAIQLCCGRVQPCRMECIEYHPLVHRPSQVGDAVRARGGESAAPTLFDLIAKRRERWTDRVHQRTGFGGDRIPGEGCHGMHSEHGAKRSRH